MFALDILNQYQSTNGTLLAAGKLYIYKLGRTELATVYGDHNGEHTIPNPVVLDDQGMAEIYLNNAFDYTVVACDAYGAEQFSRDIFPRRMGNGESIGTQLYEGIDPIVVNNDVYAISANTSRLGVVTPLYFVKDDEEETIIGFSGEAIIPSGTMNESALGFENNKITGYNGSAFSAGNKYEAGSYVDIDGNTINVTGLQPAGDYQSAGNYVSASELENLQPKGDYYSASNPSGFLVNEDITGKLDTTAFSTVSGDFLTAVPSEYVTENTLQSGLSSKLDSTAFSTVSGDFLTAHQSLEGYATEQWVEEKGYITGIDIPQSANWNNATTVVNNNSAIWNSTTNTVSSNSASWGASNPQIPITGINGIKISESGDKVVFEVSGDYATHDDLTSKQDSLTYGYHDTAISSIDNSALYDSSAHARINTLAGRISDLSSNKLDESAFSDVSGSFLTALPSDLVYTADIADMATTGDINDLVTSIAETYQPIAGMTAYQPVGDYQTAGDYYSASNPSGFITGVDLEPYQLKADMTAYQSAGNYLVPDDITGKLDTTAFSDVSGSFLTAHQSLEGYATEDWVTAQGYLTAETDWTNTITGASAYAYEQATAAIPAPFDPTYISGQIDNKLDSAIYAAASGNFLTALPQDLVYTADIADMATTGDINDLVTSIAETYQPKLSFDYNEDSAISAINGSALAGGSYQPSGNYIPYTAIDGNAFKTNSGLKIATFIGSELRTNFINNNFITLQSVNSTLGINNQVILATGSLTLKTKSDSAYVDREKIHKWDSASDYIQNNSAALNEVSAKLDTTAFSTVSGDFYTTANESGFITGAPAGTMNESSFGYDASNNITAYNGSAIGGGSAPTYDYTDNDLISAIDSSGLYATSALEAKSANALVDGGRLGYDVYAVTGAGTNSMTLMVLNPQTTPFGTTSGIYGPLYYAQGACMTYGSSAGNTQYFGGFFKGNEWYISNATAGQALRGETHASRGVHVSGATTAGYGFNLAIGAVSGVNSTGSWKYGHAEDAALRAVSSCDMYESAFEYDANDKISGYNGSAFAGGSDVPEGVMVESGLEYNAVNEISAYNGSAIAQYGAEKQFIVHDDTLVHLSNSAQYALGVQVPNVAKLMGVDETVLWSGSANTGTLNLIEPLTSFKEFKFYVYIPERGINQVLTYYDAVNTVNPGFLQLTVSTMTTGSVISAWWQGIYNINGTVDTATYKSFSIYANGQYYKQCSTTACGTNVSRMVIKKIIGIGRKS